MRRPQASFEAQPRTARLLAPKMGIGPYMTPANSCCPANFECKAFLPQSFKGSCYQIWCTITGGAYQIARRVSPCVRNICKSDSCLSRTAGCTESSEIFGEFVCICAFRCRGGRLCPPADRTGFYGNLRRIRGCPAGRCGHRPLQNSGESVLPCKF